MVNVYKSDIEQLEVDFYKVEYGLLYFKLTVGKQVFKGRFSEVFDPILDFKHWLEAISIGVKQTSFKYDPEGDDIKFDFERVHWNREVITIVEDCDDGEYLKARIERKQIVKAFYLGLLTFASSDKFESEKWEIEYIKERLFKALDKNEETIIELLAELDRNELRELLFNANPSYYISFPTAKDKSEELKLVIETEIQYNDLPEEHSVKNTPIHYNIPDDYNFWTTAKKREFVIEAINEPVEGYNGTKIDDFRSSIIEKYLENG